MGYFLYLGARRRQKAVWSRKNARLSLLGSCRAQRTGVEAHVNLGRTVPPLFTFLFSSIFLIHLHHSDHPHPHPHRHRHRHRHPPHLRDERCSNDWFHWRLKERSQCGHRARAMETFTIQDMLINSTDLNQILCNFGIKNISDCGGENGSAVEPKGKVDFYPFPPKMNATQASGLGFSCCCFFFFLNASSSPDFKHIKLSFCREPHLFLRQCAWRIWFRSSGKRLPLATHMFSPVRFCLVPLFYSNPGKRMQRKTERCYDDYADKSPRIATKITVYVFLKILNWFLRPLMTAGSRGGWVRAAVGSHFQTYGSHVRVRISHACLPPDIDQTVRIVLYSLIFLLSVLGNSLIITVLMRNRRMRTVTNLFLLSLSASDLMVSIVCIPFTLIPNLMRDFIFGTGICKLVMYFMGESELAQIPIIPLVWFCLRSNVAGVGDLATSSGQGG